MTIDEVNQLQLLSSSTLSSNLEQDLTLQTNDQRNKHQKPNNDPVTQLICSSSPSSKAIQLLPENQPGKVFRLMNPTTPSKPISYNIKEPHRQISFPKASCIQFSKTIDRWKHRRFKGASSFSFFLAKVNWMFSNQSGEETRKRETSSSMAMFISCIEHLSCPPRHFSPLTIFLLERENAAPSPRL